MWLEPLLVAGQLLAIMNPFGGAVTFLSLTHGLGEEERRRIARDAFLYIVVLLLVFTLGGTWLLEIFHVSVPGLRLGGGILLMAVAVDMLSGAPRSKKIDPVEIAAVPISTPLIVGPGTMATSILLATKYPLYSLVPGAVMAALATYLVLKYSGILVRVVGFNAMKALGRFMSIIIASIAADMIVSALRDYYAGFRPPA